MTAGILTDPEFKARVTLLAAVFGVDPDNVAAVTVEYRRVTFDLIDGPNTRASFDIRPVGKESR